tara:strand:+ start:3582 stop:3953 length:372 start_codon:yes stop_codon:yes gene_type:complete
MKGDIYMPSRNKEEARASQRRWYYRNKQKQFDRNADRIRQIARKFANYKRTLKCEFCAEDYPSCLDFHHRDPTKKEGNICQLVHRGWGWDRLMREVKKCQVLCANCHRKLHDRRGEHFEDLFD